MPRQNSLDRVRDNITGFAAGILVGWEDNVTAEGRLGKRKYCPLVSVRLGRQYCCGGKVGKKIVLPLDQCVVRKTTLLQREGWEKDSITPWSVCG